MDVSGRNGGAGYWHVPVRAGCEYVPPPRRDQVSHRRPISDGNTLTSTGSLAKKALGGPEVGGQSGHLPPWAKPANSLRRPASVQGSSSKIQRAFGPSAKLHGPWDGTREIAHAAMTTRCIYRGRRPLSRLAGVQVAMSSSRWDRGGGQMLGRCCCCALGRVHAGQQHGTRSEWLIFVVSKSHGAEQLRSLVAVARVAENPFPSTRPAAGDDAGRWTDPLRPGVVVRAAGALIASASRLNPSKHLETRTGRPGKNKVQVASLNMRGFNGPGDSLGGSMSHGIPWNPLPRPPRRPGYMRLPYYPSCRYPMYCPFILLVQSSWCNTAPPGAHTVHLLVLI